MFDLHVHLMLELHPAAKKWKLELVLRQTTSLEVISIRNRNDIEKSTWCTRR